MSSIKVIVSKNSNYIYHMLSVSKCGYDNSYGKKYRKYHDELEINILKKHERYITVCGGEHCGELYAICISMPASFDDDILKEYFLALLDLFKNENLELNFKKYKNIYELSFSSLDINYTSHKEFYLSLLHLKSEIIEISQVMINNYNTYIKYVWNDAKNEINIKVNELNKVISKVKYAKMWEKELGYKFKHENFHVVLCNSIENGPQGINISSNKNIFYITDDNILMSKFISHEFGIYLLVDILFNMDSFNMFSHYQLLESLAEYYNELICGGCKYFNEFSEYIDFYRTLQQNNTSISPKEMFLNAIKYYNIDAEN
ncbi:hypothetical protein CHL78_007550 [Romboutsia weinsteinii]|uniref:Uncharacterized protein n=1 Tax=Romboutsia weinsteinii TaxID=2020949 RepID=A0A371J4Y4_9FIRM|nr:hypothetical protein [Romboutsia weinsteinii]RDY27850.1 hypothetical protein CHL78_007550 [Romboutsia weinsteinii]